MVTYPIVLIPGLAGTRLKTHNKSESDVGVTMGKLWLGKDMVPPTDNHQVDEDTDISSPPSNVVGLNAPVYDVKADELTDHPVVANWKNNLKLKDHNGINPEVEDQNPPLETDNPTIQFNRFVDGLNGISNLFVNHGNVGEAALLAPDVRKVNYFFELATALLNTPEYRGDLGVLPKNIIAAPYDWRIGPTGLQQRYQYFSNLKSSIEELYKPIPLVKPATPVVIIAQSLGNRVTQYFLEWVKNNDLNDGKLWGQAWIDKHIERYIAVSAPWLGTPLAIRLLSTDDGFNLGGAKLSGIKKVLQSFSSIPWLLPVTEAQYQYFNTQGQFGFVRKEGVNPGQSVEPNNFRSETIENTLILGGAENTTLKYIKDYYEQDPNFSEGEFGTKAVTSPPVKKIDVIYSTGFNTPVGAYYYQEEGELKVASYLGNETGKLLPVDDGDFIVINGVRLEKADRTKQLISDDGITNSGDGVVAYGSLAYFKKWEKNPDIPNQTITPYPFVKTQPTDNEAELGIDLSHNSIIRHPKVIELIFSLLGLSYKQ